MAEKNIELDSVEIAAAVFGNCDWNIRLLENEFSVTAVCRGTQLRLSVNSRLGLFSSALSSTPYSEVTESICRVP